MSIKQKSTEAAAMLIAILGGIMAAFSTLFLASTIHAAIRMQRSHYFISPILIMIITLIIGIAMIALGLKLTKKSQQMKSRENS